MFLPPMQPRREPKGQTELTLRDHFAAAALTGLTANGDYSVESTPVLAWRMADAMLRERDRRVTEPMPKEKRAEISDRSKPINGPDPDSRVWETPVHTPATQTTPGECSTPREGTFRVSQNAKATLTDAEREAIERSAVAWETDARMGLSDGGVAVTLRGLLERTR